jgi:Carboxypeptidase regulatory-like domain
MGLAGHLIVFFVRPSGAMDNLHRIVHSLSQDPLGRLRRESGVAPQPCYKSSIEGPPKMLNRHLWLSFGFLFFVPIHLYAQYTTVVIEKVQLARSLAAVVLDPAGSPIPGVLVEEFSSDWKESLRSTMTDATGGFTFAPVKGRDVYYLQLRMNGFDPLRVRVKVDPKRGKNLQLELEIAT